MKTKFNNCKSSELEFKVKNGSIESQILSLTLRINHLQRHFTIHKNDNHSKIGLLKIVSRRRKQLNYLKRKNKNSYIKLIRSLKLRR
ncbi:hypothetical protein AOQ88_00890 [Candidatus Riesia sp. GBBU]|nr:hypothetical protein AOQ88_00890 [Candidatus Riesia sp. GBBU]